MTRAQIITEITTVLYENTSGAITPTTLAGLIDKIVDHMAMLTETDSTIEAGSVNINVGATGLSVEGTKVIGVQSTYMNALSGGASLSDVITFCNTLLRHLQTHGLIATAT